MVASPSPTILSDDSSPQLGGDLDLGGHKVGAATAAEVARLSGVSSGIQGQLDAKVASSSIGVANGVAGLDSSGFVPMAQLPSAIVDGVKFKGTWNATTNSPTLVSSTGTQGDMYRISTSGTTTLDGISVWTSGDYVVFDGSAWRRIDGNIDSVTSVAGRTGTVTLTKSDVGLGSVVNLDTSSANNIQSGTLSDARLSTNVTLLGNTFNVANKLVQLNGSGLLPALDGSLLINLFPHVVVEADVLFKDGSNNTLLDIEAGAIALTSPLGGEIFFEGTGNPVVSSIGSAAFRFDSNNLPVIANGTGSLIFGVDSNGQPLLKSVSGNQIIQLDAVNQLTQIGDGGGANLITCEIVDGIEIAKYWDTQGNVLMTGDGNGNVIFPGVIVGGTLVIHGHLDATGGAFAVTDDMSIAAAQIGTQAIYDSADNFAIDIDLKQLQNSAGDPVIDWSGTVHSTTPLSFDSGKAPYFSVLNPSALVATNGSSALTSLDTSTYPSLTELSRVKGVTSAIQTQLNAKQATLTLGNLTEATSSVLTITGGTGSIIGSGLSIQVKAASTSQAGYLSSTDWNTFNGKVSTARQVIAGTGLTGGGDLSADRTLTVSGLTTSLFAANVVDTDTSLTANSDTRLASQKAVKTYVDAVTTLVNGPAIDAQTGTTYTFVLSDAGKMVTLNNASLITATVPANSSVAFPVNTEINLAQIGAGQVTLAAAGGVTINSYNSYLKLAGQYAGATLKKTGTDTWLLIGNLSA